MPLFRAGGTVSEVSTGTDKEVYSLYATLHLLRIKTGKGFDFIVSFLIVALRGFGSSRVTVNGWPSIALLPSLE